VTSATRPPLQPKPLPAGPAVHGVLQRCGPVPCNCPDGDASATLHRNAVARRPGERQSVPSIVHDVLRSPGQPLHASAREFFEPLFSQDFSRVRIHTDDMAVESARAVSASAYTAGEHIAFDAGRYAPYNEHGRALLAHELAHVVQQGNAANVAPRASGLSDPWDTAEREASAIASGLKPGIHVSPAHSPAMTVQRAPRPRSGQATPQKTGSMIEAEDVAGIIAEQMTQWYGASRNGVGGASLDGDDEGAKWFLVALAGNLVWAATAFVAPEATLAIRLMSVGGATVGSGTLQQLAKQDLPISGFRDTVKDSLGKAYSNIADQKVGLTTSLQSLYVRAGLTARDDAAQAEKRRRAAWKFLFRDTIGFNNPAQLEAVVKSDIEAIWKDFLPCWKNMFLVITPRFIEENRGKYGLVCYYRALVSSGVADRSVGVSKTTLYSGTFGDKGEIRIGATTDIYDFPGGVKATRTSRPTDFYWGSITAEVP
jgi:hypothetical protein